jgi:nucleotide-binding universal stress UspA family protein
LVPDASGSILNAHLERRHPMFGTILLAVDGSTYSEKPVELPRDLATVGNEEVVVTHVTELLPARFQTYPAWTTSTTRR